MINRVVPWERDRGSDLNKIWKPKPDWHIGEAGSSSVC